MSDTKPEAFHWKAMHGVVVLLVLGFFMVSVRSVLNPFLLFLLLTFLLSPYSGTRLHLLVLSSTGLLTAIWLLGSTGSLLAPFILALVLAYIQHPLVRRMERRGISRGIAVTLLSIPALIGITLVVVFGIPALSRETAQFIGNVPYFIQTGSARLEQQLGRVDIPGLDETELIARVRTVQPETVLTYLRERQAELGQRAWQGIIGVGRGLGAVLTILGYVFLTPILMFYLLRDWDRITERTAALVPLPYRERVLAFTREYDYLLARYLRGQVTQAAIVGVLTWLGFWIAGFPMALMLGVVAGVFNIIPYMGVVASLIPAVVIALFTGNVLLALGKIAVVTGVVQVIDSSVLGPRIVGEAVGLHPVWIILALSLAGSFFGFVGLLIAVPLAVLVKLLVALALTRYRTSRVFSGERPLVSTD